MKYLVSLIPLVFCTILSFIYGIKTPKDYPHPSYPYKTEGILSYLSTTWFYIGLIITASFIAMFLIDDIFELITKKIKEHRTKRAEQKRNITR
jgi:hypothetical protein